MRIKSGFSLFHNPSIIVSGSMAGKFGNSVCNCFHNFWVIVHLQKICITDSFSDLHNEHKGLSTILHLKRNIVGSAYVNSFALRLESLDSSESIENIYY